MKKCLIIHHSLIDIPCSIFSLPAGHIRYTADKIRQNMVINLITWKLANLSNLFSGKI